MGSLSATSRFAVDLLREQDKAVGLGENPDLPPLPQ